MPASTSRVLVDPAGAMVYGRNSTLLAQRFDFATLQPQGAAVVLADDVLNDRSGMLVAAVSPANVLAYRSGALSQQRFDWVDREGKVLATIGSPALVLELRPVSRWRAPGRPSLSTNTTVCAKGAVKDSLAAVVATDSPPAVGSATSGDSTVTSWRVQRVLDPAEAAQVGVAGAIIAIPLNYLDSSAPVPAAGPGSP